MRTVVAFILSIFLTPTILAQGLVVFNNNPSTLVTAGNGPPYESPVSGPVGSWYFGLLTSDRGFPGPFTFAGIYATNSATAPGRFIGGTQTVNGWAPGTPLYYEVAGWSASLGPTWNPSWLVGNFGGIRTASYFGISSSSEGVAGGGTPPVPSLPLFGGTGIGSGFDLVEIVLSPIPEPSGAALMAVGAGVILFCCSRQKRKLRSSLHEQLQSKVASQ